MSSLITNNLRIYRKRAGFIQEDVAFLIAMPDYANVSRMENGLREPSLEMHLLYHLLFDMPLNGLFENIAGSVKESILKRIELRISELDALPITPQVAQRVNALNRAYKKLSPHNL